MPGTSDSEPTPLLAFGLRYVEQLIIRPGQRARYRAQLKALAVLELPSPTMPGTTYLPFGRNVEDVTPEDVRLWLSRWDRGLKTKANYHGLLFGVFAWAVSARATAASTARAPNRVVDLAAEGGGTPGVLGSSLIVPPAIAGLIHA
jgi:hypothetical protein